MSNGTRLTIRWKRKAIQGTSCETYIVGVFYGERFLARGSAAIRQEGNTADNHANAFAKAVGGALYDLHQSNPNSTQVFDSCKEFRKKWEDV